MEEKETITTATITPVLMATLHHARHGQDEKRAADQQARRNAAVETIRAWYKRNPALPECYASTVRAIDEAGMLNERKVTP